MQPAEIQVGIVTALVGAPFLIYLARQRSAGELMIDRRAFRARSAASRAMSSLRGRYYRVRASITACCSTLIWA